MSYIEILPEDILSLIWMKYFKSSILKEIQNADSIWDPKRHQSEQLKKLCTEDKGAIEFKHTDFEKLMTEDTTLPEHYCVNGYCENCKYYGFPCANMVMFGLIQDEEIDEVDYEEIWKFDDE